MCEMARIASLLLWGPHAIHLSLGKGKALGGSSGFLLNFELPDRSSKPPSPENEAPLVSMVSLKAESLALL